MSHFSSFISRLATIALCSCLAIVPRQSIAQSNEDKLSTPSNSTPSTTGIRDEAKDRAMFEQAAASIERGNLEFGMALLRQLIQLRNDFGNMSELTFQISHKLALAYFKQGDYPSVIYFANAIGRSRPTSYLWCGLRAAEYKKLRLPSTEFEELRNAVRTYPEDIANRKELAFELAQTEVPTLRNGLEALLAVEHLEKEIAHDPLIAKCIAAAAAEAGDFPLAIRLQSQYIKQVNPKSGLPLLRCQ